MPHIAKLAVSVRDIDHIRTIEAERILPNPTLRRRAGNSPRRGVEILAGGSLYWVISGPMLARQRILDIVEDRRDDNTPCTSFLVAPEVAPLVGRATRPFQGWRYLPPEVAPADLDTGQTIPGEDKLPPAMRREPR